MMNQEMKSAVRFVGWFVVLGWFCQFCLTALSPLATMLTLG
jgi:hypothetical protein